jgi:hypothetical protein
MVITPLTAALFAVIPLAVGALVTGVLLAPRLRPPHAEMAPTPPAAMAPAPPAAFTAAGTALALPPPPPTPVEPAPALKPTVVIMTRHGELLNKLEADDDACRAYAQSSVGSLVNAQAADPAGANNGEAVQASYNTAYSKCMLSLGFRIEGHDTSNAAAKVVVRPAPRVVEVVPMPPVYPVLPRPPIILLPRPPHPAVVFVP